MRRLLTWLAILGVVTGLLALAGLQAASWLQQRSAPKYITAKVSRGRVETVVNSTGTVKPVLSVSVGAFTSGPIATVNVQFNSVVKKDQLLALIDPKLQEAAVERDRAAVDSSKADLNRIEALYQQAKNNEQRARDLLAISKDYLAETDLDQYYFTRLSYEAQLRLGAAAIKQAEANLKNSIAQLEYCRILSPVDGTVIERKVDPGQTVAASFQTPELFIIGPDMDKHMFVFASVDEADIGQIRKAQLREEKENKKLVRFTVDAYPGELFEGNINQIRQNSTTTQNVVTYPVIVESANPELKLMPGMTANLTFQVEEKDKVLRIPAGALRFVPTIAQVRPEDQHYLDAFQATAPEAGKKSTAAEKADRSRQRQQRIVWVKDCELLRAVPIKLGMIENQFAEIVEGELAEGSEVVTGTG